MSEENVEIVRRIYDAVSRHDTATVIAAYDPEVEWDTSRSPWGSIMGGRLYRGHGGLRRFYSEWYEAWGDYDEVLEELIDGGEQVIVGATGRGRGRASGAAVEWSQYGVWTIRDGTVMRVVWFPTRDEALEAAGLSE
jgi:ketosteroid isomerase-like protein